MTPSPGASPGPRARSLTSVPGVAVGHADDPKARTGCTVILGPFRAAVETRGLATGTREVDALSELHVVPACQAILLTGGSAFGLAAADGVSGWLEGRGLGFPTGAARVPIVPAAVLYDLAVGRSDVRPDAAMGRRACEAADEGPVREGRVGAGCGATVGKLGGPEHADPGGLGCWAVTGGGTTVSALAVVNAFGDVVDEDGGLVAGCRAPGRDLLDTAAALAAGALPDGYGPPGSGESTTLAVVATDAPLGKRDLRILARQAMNGLIRRLRPAATSFDGDLVFAVSTGDEEVPASHADLLTLGARAEAAVSRAVLRAVGGGDEEARIETSRRGPGRGGDGGDP